MPTGIASVSATVSLDDAVEAIIVAITLGMTIPVIRGMRIWKAGFVSNEIDNGYQFEIDDCATEEVALVRIRNTILPTLLRTYGHAYSLQEKMLKGRTLEDYIVNSTTDALAVDYAECYNLSFFCYFCIVDDIPTEPLSVEDAISASTKARYT
jgi:hypothetical protein